MASLKDYKKIVLRVWVVAALVTLSEAGYGAQKRLLRLLDEAEKATQEMKIETEQAKERARIDVETLRKQVDATNTEKEKALNELEERNKQVLAANTVIEETKTRVGSSQPMLPVAEQVGRETDKLDKGSPSLARAVKHLLKVTQDVDGKDAVEKIGNLQTSLQSTGFNLGKSRDLTMSPEARSKILTKRIDPNSTTLTDAIRTIEGLVSSVAPNGGGLVTQITYLVEENEKLKKDKDALKNEIETAKENIGGTRDVWLRKASLQNDTHALFLGAIEKQKSEATALLNQLDDTTKRLSQASQVYDVSEAENNRLKLVAAASEKQLSTMTEELSKEKKDRQKLQGHIHSLKGMVDIVGDWMDARLSSMEGSYKF